MSFDRSHAVPMALTLGLALGHWQAQAAELGVQLELPALQVAEYHRPYVALWLEGADQKVVGQLALWYDVKKRDGAGQKWLKDLRTWWRKAGRDLSKPADSLSSATRSAGTHKLTFAGGQSPLADLAPGRYALVAEVAREGGGREVVRVPFDWPAKGGEQAASAQGQEEIGRIELRVKP